MFYVGIKSEKIPAEMRSGNRHAGHAGSLGSDYDGRVVAINIQYDRAWLEAERSKNRRIELVL